MANKNQVTLTFAGDSSDLEKSFDKVGSSAKDMGREAADGFDRVGEGADNVDTRAMGFRDTITGLQDLNRGLTGDFDSLADQLFMVGMGFGDLASGVANFGVQFAKQARAFIANTARMVAANVSAVATTIAGWVAQGAAALAAGAQMALAWIIGLGPIALVIAAIVGIIAILALLGVGFDDIKNVAMAVWGFILGVIQGVWNWLKDNWPLVLAILTGPIGLAVLAIVKHWDTIKDGFTAVKDWIGDRIGDVVGFFRDLPGRLARAAGDLFGFIVSAYKSAINTVIGAWNRLRIPGFDLNINLPGPVPDVHFSWGGFDFPNIPTLHQGGVFRSPRGQREGLAMLLDGETVSRPGQGGGVTIINNIQGSVISERGIVEIVRNELNRGGLRGAIR